MKKLTYNFSHPVKGIVKFLNKLNPGQKQVRGFNSPSGQFDIHIDGLSIGKWNASVEWEHDGKYYLYTEEFEISGDEAIIKT